LLEEGTGPERTYVLPIGRLEAGSTRTISILGMTTADANGAFPEARARLEYDNGTGIEVASSGAASVAGAKSASVASSDSSDLSFSLLPSSFFGWVLYVVLITLAIFSARKIRAYYFARNSGVLIIKKYSGRHDEKRNFIYNSGIICSIFCRLFILVSGKSEYVECRRNK
jgi:hypothetical protein